MRITIEYEASWRNSFLDPATSNNEALPKEGRKFIGSMTKLKNAENYISRHVTVDTVMGILNRLVGDQRKLYQARSSNNYYFRYVESKIKFEDKPEYINSEIVFIRNISGSTDQNSYTGMVNNHDPIFTSDYSREFWSILAMDFQELCLFITNGSKFNKTIELNPLVIIDRLEEIHKMKSVLNESHVFTAHKVLSESFEKFKGLNNKGEVLPISLYCSSLYLQLDRLGGAYNMDTAKTKSGGLSGVSNNGFTKKDFMNRYTTGDKKKIWGNPYMRENFVKGEGRSRQLLTKASGKLVINIDIDREQAKKLQSDIEYAGVSSFYLGKKGLAYISDMRI
ncbi:type I-Fv CRISPR-associated protein Cas5fv [Teredinibacter franksiae]|uniref:type I-Fv CRISPR-associated protein Cas5fv n=1 Tax=Teredinibacter franksiae TaxID=2761453 RepID=UPI001627B8C1|nr:type I-Fv CRISPR-associated protein Cas5fv [Teredinibacter franksiae]